MFQLVPRQWKFTLASIILISSLFASGALAANNRYCNELRGVAALKCKAVSAQKCGHLSSYWSKRECETGIVDRLDPCGKPYIKACKYVESIYWKVCRKARDLDMNREESIRAFMTRVLLYKKMNQKYQAFHAKYSSCMSPRNRRCRASKAWSWICTRAGSTFKRTYSKEVDFFLDRIARPKMKMVRKELRRRRTVVAGVLARQLLSQLTLFSKLDKVKFIRYRSSELKVMGKKIRKVTSFLKKRAKATMASRRCPRGKNNIRRIVRILRPYVRKHFSVYDRSHKLKTTIKALRLNGRRSVRKYYRRGRRITIVSYPAIACVEKRYTKTKHCRWFSISVKRKRIGSRWGRWRTYIGKSQSIQCKYAR